MKGYELVSRLGDRIGANPPKEVSGLLELMNTYLDQAKYLDLVTKALGQSHKFASRKALLEIGHFSGKDLLQLVNYQINKSHTTVHLIGYLLHKLIEWELVFDAEVIGGNLLARFQWNKEKIRMCAALGILDNTLLGLSHLAGKYAHSVPPLFATKKGDQFTGTGFLTSSCSDTTRLAIITAKHNVDPSDGVDSVEVSSDGNFGYKPLESNWILHPTLDIAYMPVSCSKPVNPIFLIGGAGVLARIVTLGYPRISMSDGPYLLAHGGELNAIISTCHKEQRLIISNLVAPGNSGGPVLDEAGLCIGMVVNSMEVQHEGGISASSSAIPADAIWDFIAPYLEGKPEQE